MKNLDKKIINDRISYKQNISDFEENFIRTNSVMFTRQKYLLNKKSNAESHFKKLLDESNIKYTREKIIYDKGNYFFTDFYIPSINVCVEIDGKEHASRIDKDLRKENKAFKESKSITVRFTNDEVLNMTSISLSKIKNKGYHKYNNSNDKIHHKTWWKINDRKISNAKNRVIDISTSENDFKKSKLENDLTIYIKGKGSNSNDYTPMEIYFKIFNENNLLEEQNFTVTEMFSSSNKAEVIAAYKALQYVYSLGNTKYLKIKLFTNSKFLEGKGSGKYKRENNDNLNVYNDSINEFFEAVDLFSDLKFQWIPKETNIN